MLVRTDGGTVEDGTHHNPSHPIKRYATGTENQASGGLMVSSGLIQAVIGIWSDDLLFAGLGLIYALIGVAWFWFEG